MSSSTGNTDERAPGSEAVPTPGYETRDANPRGIFLFLVGLLVVICLTLLATWGMFRHFSVADVAPPSASSFADVRELPAGPELQVNPHVDLLEMRARQQQELETYAWQDRNAGTVRIPIERAMDLLLQKGLPVLPGANQQEPAPGKSAAKRKAKTDAIVASSKGPNRND